MFRKVEEGKTASFLTALTFLDNADFMLGFGVHAQVDSDKKPFETPKSQEYTDKNYLPQIQKTTLYQRDKVKMPGKWHFPACILTDKF